jgi:hypothetical protein
VACISCGVMAGRADDTRSWWGGLTPTRFMSARATHVRRVRRFTRLKNRLSYHYLLP